MQDFETPIILCDDCSYRATGRELSKPVDDVPRTCTWCGADVDSPVSVVEQQDDPGPLDWQIDRDELFNWITNQDALTDTRKRNKVIDFTIGPIDIWPEYTVDEHLNAIRSSSIGIQYGHLHEHPFNEVKIHLPPAPETLHDPIDNTLDLPENFAVHYGTRALGGMPAPDGVITPHIIATDNASKQQLKRVIEQVLSIYAELYEDGEKALKTQPEQSTPANHS